MDNPSVSVIIPVYNGRQFLREAVTSILEEKIKDVQIIVVDDGSTDGSLDSVADLPITPIRLSKNQGIAAAQNRGLGLATGKYITILDSDDRLAPGGLAWRMKYLEDYPTAMAVGGRPAAIIDENGQVLPELKHLLADTYVAPKQIDIGFFQSGGIYPLLTWLYLFRNSLVKQVGHFDETLQSAHDCDFLLRVLSISSIPIQFDPVVFRRWHKNNHSLVATTPKRRLQPQTIAEVIRVCAKYGINIPEGSRFPLWETGYQ